MNISTYKTLLKEFISYKSISTDPEYTQEIYKTVTWLKELFEKHKFEVHTFKGKTTNPVILAHYKVSDDAQTVLVYGHYDVQPASLEEGWDNDPFT